MTHLLVAWASTSYLFHPLPPHSASNNQMLPWTREYSLWRLGPFPALMLVGIYFQVRCAETKGFSSFIIMHYKICAFAKSVTQPKGLLVTQWVIRKISFLTSQFLVCLPNDISREHLHQPGLGSLWEVKIIQQQKNKNLFKEEEQKPPTDWEKD